MSEGVEEIDCSSVPGTESVFSLVLLFLSVNLYISHSGAGLRVAFQKHQVMVTFLGC